MTSDVSFLSSDTFISAVLPKCYAGSLAVDSFEVFFVEGYGLLRETLKVCLVHHEVVNSNVSLSRKGAIIVSYQQYDERSHR